MKTDELQVTAGSAAAGNPGQQVSRWFQQFWQRLDLGRWLRWDFGTVRVALAGLLLVAAALQSAQLWETSPQPFASPTFALILFEFGFAAWLLAGWLPRVTWWLTVGCFTAFALVALGKLVQGEPDCGCFGVLTLSPRTTIWLDIAALSACALTSTRPACTRRMSRQHVLSMIHGCALVTLVALTSLSLWTNRQRTRNAAQAEPPTLSPHRAWNASDALALFLQDQLGVDVDAFGHQQGSRSARDLMRQCALVSGRSLRELTIREFFAAPDANHPCVLLSDTGDFAVVIGVVVTDTQPDENRTRYQVLGRNLVCQLENAKLLVDAGFTTAIMATGPRRPWQCEVGHARVAVGPLLVSCGEVRPFEQLSHQLRFHNVGDAAVCIGRIERSCGCTSVIPDEARTLAPGEVITYTVQVATGDGNTFTHYLTAPLFDNSTGDSLETRIVICGNVIEMPQIVPSSLDLGSADFRAQSILTTTMRIIGLPDEPLTIQSIDCAEIPLSFTWDASPKARDTYRVSVSTNISTRQLSPGEYFGTILITTSSRVRPRLEVPVRMTVRDQFAVYPPVIAFGFVDYGSTATQQITISSLSPDTTHVQIVSTPSWCHAHLDTSDPSRIRFEAQAERVGLHQGSVTLTVVSRGYDRTFTLPCTLFAVPKKE